MNRRLPSILFCVAIFLACGAVAVYAQTASSATITGIVTDPKGAIVPDATVTVRNADTGLERTTKTTSDAEYRFPNLPPGVYTVRVVASQSFAPAEARNVRIDVGSVQDVNFKLELAGVATVVVVTREPPLIESTRTDVSTVVNEADVARLPATSAFNVAGVSGVTGNMNDYAGMALTAPGVHYDNTGNNSDLIGPGAFNNRGNQYNIDGGNISDQVTSVRDTLGASVDEIREFQVLTNNYDAEYGQAGGLILNVVTKSGTNKLHGDFHFFARGRNMSASNFFYNQGLFSAGGPCEGLPSSCLNGKPRAPFFKHETGFTLGGPVIKDKTFWFVSYEKLLQGAPFTLTPPTGPVTVNQPDDELMFSVKLDHQLTRNNHLSARFNAQRITLDNLLVQVPGTSSPDALTSTIVHDHTLNGSLVSSITPHLVNEARMFWHRFLNSLPDKSTLPGLRGPDFYQRAAFCCPQGADQNRIQGMDNLTWIHGAHTTKAGVNISYFPFLSLFQQYHYGRWDFSGAYPFNAPGAGGNPPTTLTFASGPGSVRTKDNIYGFYVQDSWKLRSNLTMNYGLRWDYEAGAFKGGVIPKSGGGCFEANGIVSACSSDLNNFQPRLGFAWSPHFESGPLHWFFGNPDNSLVTAAFGEVTELAYLNIALDSLNFDGVTLNTIPVDLTVDNCNINPGACPDPNLSAILAAFPNLPPASVLAPFNPVGFYGRVRPISDRLRNPETRHVALSIQRELSNSLVLTAAYVGAFGFGQFGETDTNFPSINPDTAHSGFFYLGDRPDPKFAAIRTQKNDRTSSYNGFILGATKRFSHHTQFNVGYTLSKTITSSEDFYGASEPGDPRNIRAERALAYNDARHALNMSVVFDTENLMHTSGFRHLVNDWQIGWLGSAHSMNPYALSTGEVPFSGTSYPGIGAETQQRPNLLPDGTLSGLNIASNTGSNLLISESGVAACQAATTVCPAQTTFVAPAGASTSGPKDSFSGASVDFQFLNGDVGRNSGRGDPYYRFDFNVARTIKFPKHESWRVELRADFFNIFNHTNFLLFNANDVLDLLSVSQPGSANFTTCTLCLDPFSGQYHGADGQPIKLAQLQRGRVSPKTALGSVFGGLGDPAVTDVARQMQLSLHVRW
jgi:Carboxypeptidase regulatory-like domain/TonB dependent receptor